MIRTLCTAAAALLLGTSAAAAQDGKYTIKTEKAAAPAELNQAVAKLLGDESVKFYDPKGGLVCTLWFRKEVPSDATPEQVKNGLTFAELKETTILGAVKVEELWSDYRKQKLPPGVYTLRFGVQPMDGDHMGASPTTTFCLMVSAKMDTDPGTMEPKEMIEKSMKSIGLGHPGVLMLLGDRGFNIPERKHFSNYATRVHRIGFELKSAQLSLAPLGTRYVRDEHGAVDRSRIAPGEAYIIQRWKR